MVAILGPGLMNAMLAWRWWWLPHYVRIARAAVIAETGKDYVTAARNERRQPPAADVQRGVAQLHRTAESCRPRWGISTAILDAAALGFLGLAPSRPHPSGARCWPTPASSCCARWV